MFVPHLLDGKKSLQVFELAQKMCVSGFGLGDRGSEVRILSLRPEITPDTLVIPSTKDAAQNLFCRIFLGLTFGAVVFILG